MYAWCFVLCVALYTSSVYCSYYHGPTAKPVVLHNGYLADTHEVATAKSAHLAALAKESHGYAADYDYNHHHGDIRYHGPTAKPVVLHNGYLADTHEVAAAKSAHLAALAKESHGYAGDYDYNGNHHGDIRYHGPTAKPVVLHNGYLADTHEVAAAKNAHLAALAKESHYGHSDSYGYDHGQEYSGSYDDHHGDTRYHGPTAIPHVLHDGHIADTHEVVAAKAEHFAAVAKATHGGYSGRYASGYGADHGHSHHVAPYHGPLAKPVVLKSGYLADTHEVAAAKHHHLEALHQAGSHGHYDHHY